MYDAQLNKYKKGANFFIRHKVSSAVIVAASIAALVWLMAKTPTALVPNEDTGTFFVMVDMPPGTSQERTKETMDTASSQVKAPPTELSSSASKTGASETAKPKVSTQ